MKDESEVNGAKRKKAASKEVCLRSACCLLFLLLAYQLTAYRLTAYFSLPPSSFILELCGSPELFTPEIRGRDLHLAD
jgi:hypothetical protein